MGMAPMYNVHTLHIGWCYLENYLDFISRIISSGTVA